MAIYTRFGSEVKLTEARLIPVWIVKHPSKVKWHYTPQDWGKTVVRVDETPIWHVKGEYGEGGLLCDGKWVVLSDLVADGGWKTIQDECERLNPENAKKYHLWNQTGGAAASEIFKPEPVANVA